VDTKEYIHRYFENSKRLIKALEGQEKSIEKIVNILFATWQLGAPVFIMGNGGSASTASHFAADLAKTVNDLPGKRGIRALAPWDNIPLMSAIVNDRLKEDYFTAWLDTFFLEPREFSKLRIPVGIGISVHGGSGSDFGGNWSQNLLKGLQYIKDRSGITIGFSGFDGGPMAKMADVAVVVPVEEKSLGTPLVESFHVVLTHLIAFRLKELISETKSA